MRWTSMRTGPLLSDRAKDVEPALRAASRAALAAHKLDARLSCLSRGAGRRLPSTPAIIVPFVTVPSDGAAAAARFTRSGALRLTSPPAPAATTPDRLAYAFEQATKRVCRAVD